MTCIGLDIPATLCPTRRLVVAARDKAKSDCDLIQGRWKVVSTQVAGEVRPVPQDYHCG
jgi:hypothetical protein